MNKEFIIFLFFSFIIIDILSYDELKKYESIKTSASYILFDSSEFLEGESMYFEIESQHQFENYMNYQYYDNKSNISLDDLPYTVISKVSSSVSTNNAIKSFTRYFTIEKKKSELNDLNGDYLLLNFDCIGIVEFKNNKSNNATTIIVVVVVVFSFLIIFIIVLIICCRRYRNLKYNNARIPIEYDLPNNYYYPGQPVYPMPNNYIYHNPNVIYNNPNCPNYPYQINPLNVQVIGNGAIPQPQPQPQPSSKRDIISHDLEKPKLQK